MVVLGALAWVAPGAAGPAAGDGTLIAFSASYTIPGYVGPYRQGIWVVRPNGGGLRRLTPNSIGAGWPTWSPDGKRILFVGSPAGDDFANDLYVMRADGSGLRRLAKIPGSVEDPDWSPDGRKIVFGVYGDDFKVRVAVMGANGRGLRMLTPKGNGAPDWSPDGRSIAFSSARGGKVRVWIMNADGSEQRLLIRRQSDWPAWSPDGGEIAFVSRVGRDTEIAVAQADGTAIRTLSRNSFGDGQPSWSPNGERIVFESDRTRVPGFSGRPNLLFVMGADGRNQRRLTRIPADPSNVEATPAWQPRS